MVRNSLRNVIIKTVDKQSTSERGFWLSLTQQGKRMRARISAHTKMRECEIPSRTFRRPFSATFKTPSRRPFFSSYVISHGRSEILQFSNCWFAAYLKEVGWIICGAGGERGMPMLISSFNLCHNLGLIQG